MTFEYQYDDEADRKDLEPKLKGGTQLRFALGQVHDVSLEFKTPVRSQYMHYVCTIGDHVKVKDVDEIEIKMSLRVRTGHIEAQGIQGWVGGCLAVGVVCPWLTIVLDTYLSRSIGK